MSEGLTSREEFEFLADLVMRHSDGDDTTMSLSDQHSGTTRFANNHIIQNVDTRRTGLRVAVTYGRQRGMAGTTDLSAGAVQDAIARAAAIARVSPEDPEYLPPLGPQTYETIPSWCAETSRAGHTRRLAESRQAITCCRRAGMSGAGIVSSSEGVASFATSRGLRAYDLRTEARWSLTATQDESTGWAAGAHRSITHLGVAERAARAIEKAQIGQAQEELPPGRYTVVLEPAAVAGLLSWLLWMLDAKSYYKGTSVFTGKLDSPIVDRHLHLRNLPAHPALLASPFDSEGLPNREASWITKGVLTQLIYDRYTAHIRGIEPTARLDAPCLSSERTVEDVITSTERGILVTNFWYLRLVNATDLTLTGMTRDGTFLIEGGRIQGTVKNFRFHDSPLRAFSQVEACTSPVEAVTAESGKMLVPAMRIRDFNFSSVTTF